MLTLNEARKLQKEREGKAIGLFLAIVIASLLLTYILMEYTTIFELSSVFYLIPAVLIGFAVKKTQVYRLLTQKEFVGKVVYMNVYEVREQRVKGEKSYMMVHGLEAEIIIESESGKSKSLQLPAGPGDNLISEGMTLALLRFIDQPIIIK